MDGQFTCTVHVAVGDFRAVNKMNLNECDSAFMVQQFLRTTFSSDVRLNYNNSQEIVMPKLNWVPALSTITA